MSGKELGQQPAFPQQDVLRVEHLGMTMQTYIAIEMMKALVTNGDVPSRKIDVATCACDYADILLDQLAEDQP